MPRTSGSKTSKKRAGAGRKRKGGKSVNKPKIKSKGGSLFDVGKKYKAVSKVFKTLADNGVPFANDIADAAGSIGLGRRKRRTRKGGNFVKDFGDKFTELSNKAAAFVLPKLGIDISKGGGKRRILRI